jgi:CBS-domain-containing membrane protein
MQAATPQVRSMKRLLLKMGGAGGARPARPKWQVVALAALGGFLAMATLVVLAIRLDLILLLGSFGASCVLVFGYPDVPFAQPANVVLGHLISTLIGLTVVQSFGYTPWTLGLAVGAATAAMMATRTVHPPAGSNPVIIYLSHPGWSFVLFPVLAGALALILIGIIFNNVTRKTRYPSYW